MSGQQSGGYAPYAPYPPGPTVGGDNGGGQKSPYPPPYPTNYPPMSLEGGGMGYAPPAQAPYPTAGGPPAGSYPPQTYYFQSSPYPSGAPGVAMQYAPAQLYGSYPPPVMIQPGMAAQSPPPPQALIGAAAPPVLGGWMTIPQGIPSCPPGLEYLTSIDQLLVHQKVELLEAFTGFEAANKYTVKNTIGQKVYWAVEDTDCCTRNCCGPARPFDMKILDYYQNEVLHFYRPLRCQSCCFPCCLQSMEVSAPPGNVIGTVEQNWSILKPQFSIKDQAGSTVLKIEGPFCTFNMCGDVEFKVVTNDGRHVGKISKQWSGLVREAFTDSDHFGINFPMDLDVRVKATLLGALFLIDYMFFEKPGNKEGDRPGML
ncbi:phospholipid scramblase 2-like isoform X2 [Toxorhynchites rutilus septentrionalis]|uniref:phospholipid scramblase 2-like isoform X2 n=1 Tax=Toxorhynchites rutilus septentrionalis TaxID=329112 RepID=UPI00247A492B|nr:phospholipid scramblase 2-like isoform X2 [Toxorhynchites rutilus septentrionalis]